MAASDRNASDRGTGVQPAGDDMNSGRGAGIQSCDDADLDDKVRRALEAPPPADTRIVARALRSDSESPRRVVAFGRRAFAAAALVLVAGVVSAVLMWPRRQPPTSGSRGVMTNEGDIMVIKIADRPITLIDPGADASAVPAGTMSIVLLGEPK